MAVGTIKPIETRYLGYRFRSRREARWAVFYKTLGIAFEYEKEGFDLGDRIYYLPDFWLPKQRCWIEIKGEPPNDAEEEKCRRLALASNCPVYLFFTDPGMPDDPFEESAYIYWRPEWIGEPDQGNPQNHIAWDNCQWWCECPRCGYLGIEFQAMQDRLPCTCNPEEKYGEDSRRILRAYNTARAERFGT